jgi:glycosyltransferase involved in cell wall biosynthesis
MKIALVHYPGRIARLEACRAGKAPREFLFGGIELEQAGHEIRHFEIDGKRRGGRAAALVNRLTARRLLPPHLGGGEIGQARRLLGELSDFDAVVGTNIRTALALAVWKRARRLRPALVGVVTGLADSSFGRSRRVTTTALLKDMQVMLYGEAELEAMLKLYPRLTGRVHVNQFGVDVEFWKPDPEAQGGYVLALGNDGRRDYETLARAAESIPAPVRIYTRRPRPERLPENVSWQRADWYEQVLSDEEVRALYQGASVVVVPLRDSIQPSGQSVTLQAMACGKAVVLTDTRGLWSRSALRDGENSLLVPPGDAEALALAVCRLLDAPELAERLGEEARSEVCARATSQGYAERMLGICRLAVGARARASRS